MKDTSRLYCCAGCQRQTHICSHCDRGNIYCSSDCSSTARQRSIKAAGQRYQASLAGKMKHAARQRRYRQRQKNIKVTHQGCAISASNALLLFVLNNRIMTTPQNIQCHFCGRPCSPLVRYRFMQHRSAFLKQLSWLSGP